MTFRRSMEGGRREGTQCPIFLLQTSTMGLTADFNHSDWEYGDDGQMKHIETGKTMDGNELDDFLVERGMGRRHWTTFDGGVWFTREEAREYGDSRAYNYGRYGKDWRVFCVCAHGELREILDEVTDYG